MRKSNRSLSSATRYQRQFGGNNPTLLPSEESKLVKKAAEAAARRGLRQEQGETIDSNFGYHRLEDQPQQRQQRYASSNSGDDVAVAAAMQRRGWLFHMLPTTVSVAAKKVNLSVSTISCSLTIIPLFFFQRIDSSSGDELAGLDLYFIDAEGDTFKTTVLHRPYFYVLTRSEDENLGQLLLKKYAGLLSHVEHVPMVDLDKPNHLSPNHTHRMVWKLLFDNVSQLMDVRGQLFDLIKSNSKGNNNDGAGQTGQDMMDIEALMAEHPHAAGGGRR